MDRIGKTLILALGSLVLTGSSAVVFADTPENPYRVIAERNAFDLKPYQEPPGPPKAPDALTDLKLSGFTKIGNIKRLLLVGMNPKEPGRLVYYEIEEKVTQDGIEVLEIDELNGRAKIRRGGGLEIELSYEKNGMSPTKVPAPANPTPGAPGAPGVPRPGMPAAANPPHSGPVIVGKNNPAANPSPYFQPAANPASLAVPGAATPADTSRSGLRQIPTRQVRTAPPAQPPNNLSSEEQVILLEAQRMRAAQQGTLLPPTPGLPSLPGGAPGVPPN